MNGLSASTWLAVAIAGGCGSVARVASSALIERLLGVHLVHAGMLAVNLLGAFAVGIVAVVLPPGPARIVVAGGLLGGFTTFGTLADVLLSLALERALLALLLQLVGHLVLATLLVLVGRLVGHQLLAAIE